MADSEGAVSALVTGAESTGAVSDVEAVVSAGAVLEEVPVGALDAVSVVTETLGVSPVAGVLDAVSTVAGVEVA